MKKSIMVCVMLFVSAVLFSSFSAESDTSTNGSHKYCGFKMGAVGIGVWKRLGADTGEIRLLKTIKTAFDSDKAFLSAEFGCDYYIAIKAGTLTFTGKKTFKDGRLFEKFFGDTTEIQNSSLEICRMPAGPSISIDLFFNTPETAMKQMITFIKAYH